MTMETVTEHGEPSPEPVHDTLQTTPADPGLQARATNTVTQLLQKHPRIAKDIRDTLRARVHLAELTDRADRAEKKEVDSEQHESNLHVKLDPGDRRTLGFPLCLVIVIALTVLDAVPLNWAAQAFGLNSAGTWLVTFILVVASIGAMLGFEITRGDPRRRGVLTAVVAMVYLALLGLRTEFLITVSSDSLPVAVLQSTLLTAISAGLSCAARRSWPGPGTSATHGLAPAPRARARPRTTPAPPHA